MHQTSNKALYIRGTAQEQSTEWGTASVQRAGIKVHSRANAKLEAGLVRLGAHCGEIPRNSDTGHACGHCAFGCAYGAKQDGTATFLADAVQAGARVLTGECISRCHLPCTLASPRAQHGGQLPDNLVPRIVQGGYGVHVWSVPWHEL